MTHPSIIKEEDASEYLLKTDVDSIDTYLDDNYGKYFISQDYLAKSKQIGLDQKINNFKDENIYKSPIKTNFSSKKKSGVVVEDDDDEEIFNINKINSDLLQKFNKQVEIKIFSFTKVNPNAFSIFSAFGILLKYDLKTDNLEIISENALFQIFQIDDFEYYLVVDEEGNKQTHTFSIISQEINLVLNKKENSIIWLGKDSNVVNAYNFIFEDLDKLNEIKKLMTKSQYEINNKNKFEDLKQDEREWLENINNFDLDASSSALDIEMDLESDYMESNTGGTNISSAQAYLHDRTFIIREDNVISVYKSDEDDHCLKVIFNVFIRYIK